MNIPTPKEVKAKQIQLCKDIENLIKYCVDDLYSSCLGTLPHGVFLPSGQFEHPEVIKACILAFRTKGWKVTYEAESITSGWRRLTFSDGS